ncbi:MAG: hypothetical protein WCF85_18105 [Rhodospirillaceae bacterium]
MAIDRNRLAYQLLLGGLVVATIAIFGFDIATKQGIADWLPYNQLAQFA